MGEERLERFKRRVDADFATIPLARFDHDSRQWVPWPFGPEDEPTND